MMKTGFRVLLQVAVIALVAAGTAAAQEADTARVVGKWTIDVYAGEATYTLNLEVTAAEGQLAGKISESMGAFSDIPVSDNLYDGDNFSFSFVAPTPPDGSSRMVKAEFKVGADELNGTITVPDIEATVEAKATR